ncbi:hypothetical protein NCLIV_002860 [Neospora caninum Liverpool]|uniref:Ribosomal protein S9 n=1 Tax=Neospora caninum (strain Liverpool) TaxID=572307 RepID=F0V7V7_NEOCL|nr:hypothetical protein NCLIV_002860 [Neospora caninum Liverpool]CBZ49798.1 hypothetical protein NCLIV_002860 [Neospora caninum Liverpool]|eukprot:XP_003879833.1 hypothetical protein NCLIV_002860 [Neospora caninum Liverpool]
MARRLQRPPASAGERRTQLTSVHQGASALTLLPCPLGSLPRASLLLAWTATPLSRSSTCFATSSLSFLSWSSSVSGVSARLSSTLASTHSALPGAPSTSSSSRGSARRASPASFSSARTRSSCSHPSRIPRRCTALSLGRFRESRLWETSTQDGTRDCSRIQDPSSLPVLSSRLSTGLCRSFPHFHASSFASPALSHSSASSSRLPGSVFSSPSGVASSRAPPPLSLTRLFSSLSSAPWSGSRPPTPKASAQRRPLSVDERSLRLLPLLRACVLHRLFTSLKRQMSIPWKSCSESLCSHLPSHPAKIRSFWRTFSTRLKKTSLNSRRRPLAARRVWKVLKASRRGRRSRRKRSASDKELRRGCSDFGGDCAGLQPRTHESERDANVFIHNGSEWLWQAEGTGTRKRAAAHVIIRRGTGQVRVNKDEDLYVRWPFYYNRMDVLQPFYLTGTAGIYDLFIHVRGGGSSGQAGAVRLAVGRALVNACPACASRLEEDMVLYEDTRQRMPKMPGRMKARKMRTWTKR